MARASVYQQLTCFTVPRDNFLKYVVYNDNLSKTDLKVLMLLLTKLDGVNPKRNCDPGWNPENRDNFVPLSPKNISIELQISKKKVSESIDHLLEEGILEKGDTKTVKNGYRFAF